MGDAGSELPKLSTPPKIPPPEISPSARPPEAVKLQKFIFSPERMNIIVCHMGIERSVQTAKALTSRLEYKAEAFSGGTDRMRKLDPDALKKEIPQGANVVFIVDHHEKRPDENNMYTHIHGRDFQSAKAHVDVIKEDLQLTVVQTEMDDIYKFMVSHGVKPTDVYEWAGPY